MVHATRSGDVVEGSLQDVTERKTANDRLRFLADHDPLTGILNRRGIEMNFARLARRRTPRPAALAYLDLDRFKLINDLYGHPAGDEVLRQLCERVKSHLAEAESFARVGGDEFVILFHDAPIVRARAICAALVQAIEDLPFRIGDKAFQVKGSIGLIELDREISFRDAVATADRACREAKTGQQRARRRVRAEQRTVPRAHRGTAADRADRAGAGGRRPVPRDAADHVAGPAVRLAELRGPAADARPRQQRDSPRQDHQRGRQQRAHGDHRPLGPREDADLDRAEPVALHGHPLHLRQPERQLAERRALRRGRVRDAVVAPAGGVAAVPGSHRERGAARPAEHRALHRPGEVAGREDRARRLRRRLLVLQLPARPAGRRAEDRRRLHQGRQLASGQRRDPAGDHRADAQPRDEEHCRVGRGPRDDGTARRARRRLRAGLRDREVPARRAPGAGEVVGGVHRGPRDPPLRAGAQGLPQGAGADPLPDGRPRRIRAGSRAGYCALSAVVTEPDRRTNSSTASR